MVEFVSSIHTVFVCMNMFMPPTLQHEQEVSAVW